MNEEELQEIEERLKKSTPGPWRNYECGWIQSDSLTVISAFHDNNFASDVSINPSDRDLITNAPTDIAHLIAEVRRLKELLEIDNFLEDTLDELI
jgi:hypothetical protein